MSDHQSIPSPQTVLIVSYEFREQMTPFNNNSFNLKTLYSYINN